MATAPPDDDSALVLRLIVAPDDGLRVRVIAVSAMDGERLLGVVTSAAAAAALVRGWIDGMVDLAAAAVSPRGPARGR